MATSARDVRSQMTSHDNKTPFGTFLVIFTFFFQNHLHLRTKVHWTCRNLATIDIPMCVRIHSLNSLRRKCFITNSRRDGFCNSCQQQLLMKQTTCFRRSASWEDCSRAGASRLPAAAWWCHLFTAAAAATGFCRLLVVRDGGPGCGIPVNLGFVSVPAHVLQS